MKLAMSNIAWTAEKDEEMYGKLQKYGFEGIEIAPTRIFPEKPYEKKKEAEAWAGGLKAQYALTIPSMQSIWFGQDGNLFADEIARRYLIDYTKQAMLFAEAIGCRNLVFGCPRNRSIPEGLTRDEQYRYYEQALLFFAELADFASEHNTVLAMEANPPIYNTNFINTTAEAFALVKEVGKPGFQINLDLGTMICNEETVSSIGLEEMVPYINHVHVSEPKLAMIVPRALHGQVADVLRDGAYDKFVSIEMGKNDKEDSIEQVMAMIQKQFGDK